MDAIRKCEFYLEPSIWLNVITEAKNCQGRSVLINSINLEPSIWLNISAIGKPRNAFSESAGFLK